MFKDCNEAYKSLKSNPDIVILKADKGSSIVLLNKKDYILKINDTLVDKDKFIKLGHFKVLIQLLKFKSLLKIYLL